MAEWQHFKLEQERPDSLAPNSESQRKILEMLVATKIASLLAYYAKVDQDEVNNGSIEETDGITYEFLSIDPFPLEDDDEIKIEQIPTTTNGYLTDRGVHCIECVDEDDVPYKTFSIFDPAVYSGPDQVLVVGPTGELIPLDVLHELIDALTVFEEVLKLSQQPNNPPFDTTAYPKQVIEPEFAEIIQDF